MVISYHLHHFPKIPISTTMDSPDFPTGKSPRSLQGPRPAPLRVHKDSHKIRKPPIAPQPHHHHQPPQHHHYHQQQQQQQFRPPVIIYTVSPKVIHTNPNEFMTLVQRLTGPSAPSPVGSSFSGFQDDAGAGAVSPAARFATIEKAAKSPDGRKAAQTVDLETEGVEMSYFPGILSPGPGSLPPIPANYFSPLTNDFFHGLSPVLHSNRNYNNLEGNNFIPSPTNLLFSPPNFDLFHTLFDL
ncbi:hypothetical protein L1987_13909 [Smallanthus sonchifolius]|uniref:Uncharacterized protein n=1 Tax=Smallanthus sonchifolius TaxID=185202 RepID=A0ACB9JK55_9ASTR|nr:hypothetical protein L1987_13909 [Smallanthus sonchifolius]